MGEGESHVTRTGLVMGTPGFIAPEIIEGTESDEITDWWSVSSVLAFAATGKPVFGTKPMMAVLEREASGNAEPHRSSRHHHDGVPCGAEPGSQQALHSGATAAGDHRGRVQPRRLAQYDDDAAQPVRRM